MRIFCLPSVSHVQIRILKAKAKNSIHDFEMPLIRTSM
jgi:hypothetical protein